jgi:4-hydroxymandelate oxidase
MTMTRREALMRTASGMSALALSGTRTALPQEPTDTAIPAGVVTLDDVEALVSRGSLRRPSKSFAAVRPTRSLCDGIVTPSTASRCVPVLLVDVSKLNTRLTLFGQVLAFPIVLAPAGVHGLLHPQGELETARGAAKADAVLVIPSFPARPVEEIARVPGRPPWCHYM